MLKDTIAEITTENLTLKKRLETTGWKDDFNALWSKKDRRNQCKKVQIPHIEDTQATGDFKGLVLQAADILPIIDKKFDPFEVKDEVPPAGILYYR